MHRQVGANIGDDATLAQATFMDIQGMCKDFSVPHRVISIEVSPSVFCQLTETAARAGWGHSTFLPLNIALSEKSGFMSFVGDGREGGKLKENVGPKVPDLSLLKRRSTCNPHAKAGASTDTVPVFRLDDIMQHHVREFKVWALKIDTEGHDEQVIRGSSGLLDK